MKKTFITLGLISAIAATVLSTTSFFNIAIIPIIVAFISGLLILYISRRENSKTKVIQYIFILVIISLCITIYKGIEQKEKDDSKKQLEQIHTKKQEDSQGIKKTDN